MAGKKSEVKEKVRYEQKKYQGNLRNQVKGVGKEGVKITEFNKIVRADFGTSKQSLMPECQKQSREAVSKESKNYS